MEENTAIELTQEDGEILVDSRIIARGIDVTHKAFMETLRTYQSELEEFGKVRFETAPSGKTNQPQNYALLNRNQTGIAISFSRNTKTVVRFKVDLFHRIDAMEQTIFQLRDPVGQFSALQQENAHLRELARISQEAAEQALLIESAHGLSLEDTGRVDLAIIRIYQLIRDIKAAQVGRKESRVVELVRELFREQETIMEYTAKADRTNVVVNFAFSKQKAIVEAFHEEAQMLFASIQQSTQIASSAQQKQLPQQGE